MSHLKSKHVGSELVLFKKNGTAEHGSGLNHSNFRQNLEFCRIPIGIRNLVMGYVAQATRCHTDHRLPSPRLASGFQ